MMKLEKELLLIANTNYNFSYCYIRRL